MGAYVGTSGWSYDHWVGVLYPPGDASLERLDAYARRFRHGRGQQHLLPLAEGRGLRRPGASGCPTGFLISAKASRGLTQARKLNDPERWLERMEPRAARLGEKRGVLLVPAPARLSTYDHARLDRLPGRRAVGWVRTAVEFRHPSWDARGRLRPAGSATAPPTA